MSDQKQNCMSFVQKRQIICLLDEGVSHFVDRLDIFCAYLSSIIDSIFYIRNLLLILSIVVNFEYLPTSLCNLLSNTGYLRIGFFASFPVHLVGQKNTISTILGDNIT